MRMRRLGSIYSQACDAYLLQGETYFTLVLALQLVTYFTRFRLPGRRDLRHALREEQTNRQT